MRPSKKPALTKFRAPSPEMLESLVNALRREGLRLSPQRMAILRALARSGSTHPSASVIFDEARREAPHLSLATVYNTLERLRGFGAVKDLGFPGGPARFDVNDEPHANLVCTGCGRIEDVPLGPLTPTLHRLAAGVGFTAQSERLDFYGLCRCCGSSALRASRVSKKGLA